MLLFMLILSLIIVVNYCFCGVDSLSFVFEMDTANEFVVVAGVVVVDTAFVIAACCGSTEGADN